MSTTEVLDQTLVESLRRHSAERPAHSAVEVSGTSLTYEQLMSMSQRLASALIARGIGPTDRVAFLGRESVHYYGLLFAAASVGAVLVPINPRLTTAEVGHIVTDSNAALVFLDSDSGFQHQLADRAVYLSDEGMEAFLDAGDGSVSEFTPSADTPVAQLYTSGTTGLPKGVVLAHRSFFAIARSLIENNLDWVRVFADDRCLVGIPGFHVGGLWYACQSFNAGATVIGMPEFNPVAARHLIRDKALTSAIFVPAMLRSILTLADTDASWFSSLRKVIYGGAPIADALMREALKVFDADFAQIYGLTETGNTAVCLPPEDHRGDLSRLGAAGRPYPAVEAKVIDEHGQSLGTDVIGEICLRTPAAMIGYHQQPDATAATLQDGWVRTGDAGIIDADGYIFLKDRLNDMIIVGGENVYPVEVENALCDHPAVADAAVIGIPDESSGEAVRAFIQFRNGHTATTRELGLHLRGKVADFKLPRGFEVVESIPRNPSGKILRRELREPFWRGHTRQVN